MIENTLIILLLTGRKSIAKAGPKQFKMVDTGNRGLVLSLLKYYATQTSIYPFLEKVQRSNQLEITYPTI